VQILAQQIGKKGPQIDFPLHLAAINNPTHR
jgi:hypothetical protein